MAKRSRKRKLESEEEADNKWELTNILNEELREEMATMWEIPQIFHFLHVSKEALNISRLSMYEMERMLAMPRASKQLAMIMTCLLGPSLSKAKMRKVPPMPYDFWVNVLTHKVKGWFKVYHSKHRDIVKVLETIGVEPEFWRIFPDDSIIDEKDFDDLNFKQRVWILKTLCDTLMHSRKTVQDEIAKQLMEDNNEIVLGADRYGAKFIYFPLFLENDLRVYRHCIDNTILSTVRPPPWKEGQPSSGRSEKNSRGKRKRSRWKNGSLPREKRRSKKSNEDEVKMSGDSAIGSSMNEDTNFSGTSTCSNNNNNNNIVNESSDRNRSRSPSKMSDLGSGGSIETRSGNPKSSGYDTNTSTSDGKSLNGAEPEEMFRGFGIDNGNENSVDAIGSIHDILNRLTTKVSETVKSENSKEERTAEIESSAVSVREEEDEEDDDDEEEEQEQEQEHEDEEEETEAKMSNDERRSESRADSTCDDENWAKYSPKKTKNLDPDAIEKELMIFTGILADLSFSTFELAADSVESLRDLATSLMTPEMNETRRTTLVPKCEMKLGRAMEDLAESLKDIEPKLRESTRKARTKLKRELINFRDGIIEDQDASGDVDRGSNRWIIGSQGCPLLSTSETLLQTLSDSALSPSDSENNAENDLNDPDDGTRESVKTEFSEDSEDKKDVKDKERRVRIKIEKPDSEDNDDDEDTQPQTRRVLRARGISSYTEQLSSDEEEAYELEEWSRAETLNPTPSTSDGTSGNNASSKTGQNGDESEEKDSDQDWILPGARKRKSKRSPGNRRVKTSQQKISSNSGNSHDQISNVSPPLPEDNDQLKSRKITKDPTSTDGSFICKVESVHSELDIKDEGTIYEYNRSNVNPSGLPENYSLPRQNSSIRPTSNARPTRPVVPPLPTGMMPQQLPPGYYVQGPRTYFDPRYVQYAYPPANRAGLTYTYHQPPPPPPHPYPGQSHYWQPGNFPPMPPGAYPGNIRPSVYPPQRGVIPQRHQAPSTTLYGARLPNQLTQNRMPGPRPISVQNHAIRFPTRPRAPINQSSVPRRYTPRQAMPLNTGSRLPQPNRQNQRPTEVKKIAQKSTSLILLSDSDDEIEMIVPDKQTIGASTIGQNRKSKLNNKNRETAALPKPKTRPVVTSQITVPKSRELLSPQMIQRMSQGGISITPVKPPASKQKPGENAQGTKLVVVVNETGSHYALALPNGSKLILTPEQVAQIRASNGGKLVL